MRITSFRLESSVVKTVYKKPQHVLKVILLWLRQASGPSQAQCKKVDDLEMSCPVILLGDLKVSVFSFVYF